MNSTTTRQKTAIKSFFCRIALFLSVLLGSLLVFQTVVLSVHQAEHAGQRLSQGSQKAQFSRLDQDCQLCSVLSHWTYRPVLLQALTSVEPESVTDIFETLQYFTSQSICLPSVRAPPLPC